MSKLMLQDIQLYQEGQQIKRFIEARYGSLKEFYVKEAIDTISLKTLMNYCSDKKIHSSIFKCLMVEIFDTDWNDIVLSPERQIKTYVDAIYNNIVRYRDESDLQTFEKLVNLCDRYNLSNEKAIMLRNVAKHYYYRDDNKKAIEMYQNAIQITNDRFVDALVILNTELAEHYHIERNIFDAEKHLDIAASLIKDHSICNAALYKYYFRRGMIKKIDNKAAEAREFLEKSILYAETNNESISEKGASYLAIGTTYKMDSDYEQAKAYYFKALLHFHISDTYGRTVALNNVADIYRILKDYHTAIKYIEDALALLDKEGITNRYLVLKQTFAEIKLLIGDTSACYSYFDVLKNTIHTSIDKKIIKTLIVDMINLIKDKQLLLDFQETILYLKSHIDNAMYQDDLYSCIGRITEKLIKEGQYEKFKSTH